MKLMSRLLRVAMMAGFLMAVPDALARQTVNRSPDGAQTARPQVAAKAAVPRLKVLFCDQAGVATKTREEGQRLAARVFLEAGIVLEWLDGREHSVTEANCVLRVQGSYSKLGSRLPDRTVAFAPAGGRHITVFWDRLAVEAAAGSHSEAMLLGYVMTHELGHLLLPPGYHSAYGVMQGRLHYQDLSEARRLGNLCFSKTEVARMQAFLKADPADGILSQFSARH